MILLRHLLEEAEAASPRIPQMLMQQQPSCTPLRLVHPDAKSEVCYASLHEVPVLEFAQLARGPRQLDQRAEGPAHGRTNQQHWLFIADALLHLLHLLLIIHVSAGRVVHYEAALEAHVDSCTTEPVRAERRHTQRQEHHCHLADAHLRPVSWLKPWVFWRTHLL